MILFRSKLQLVQACPHLIPYVGNAAAPLLTSQVGGTVTINEVEQIYVKVVKQEVRGWGEKLLSHRQVAELTGDSTVMSLRKMTAVGMIVWDIVDSDVFMISPSKCLIPMKAMIGKGKMPERELNSFEEIWREVRMTSGYLFLPSSFPVHRLSQILVLNNFRIGRIATPEGCMLRYISNRWEEEG